MPGEELRELDKVRVANDMVVIEGILGDESGERMAQLDEVLQEYLSRMDKPDPIERHTAHGFPPRCRGSFRKYLHDEAVASSGSEDDTRARR